MSTKQTAVEWLLKELEEQKLIKLDKLSTILFNKNFATRYELIIYEAKQMEKEQIINACLHIASTFSDIKLHEDILIGEKKLAEQYYNETYN